jgi:hypothetical protein
MANTLTFTSTPFLQGFIASTASNSSNNTKYDVLDSDANDRRIYGMAITSTDAGAQTVKIHLNNGSTSYQAFTLNVPLNSGNSTSVASVDIMGSVYGASIFQKQRDANGVPYFNLPANWKVQMEYNTTLASAEVLNVFVFGESYA